MKRGTFVILAVAIMLPGVIGYWYFSQLDPVKHFEKKKHPVLVAPPREQMNNEEQETPEEAAKKFNIIMLGSDTRKGEPSRADLIMVAHINPTLKTVNLVSVWERHADDTFELGERAIRLFQSHNGGAFSASIGP
jgi:anionic cell wall polymer biosynthesis LytR-Cps2A-Psr (LCP) family protein